MKPSDFLTELSNDKLTQYKTAAAADASKADKEGDFKKGDKRFSGIVKATKKQFDNDAKKDVAEGDVVPFPKKHPYELLTNCPKCGGSLQGGKDEKGRLKMCIPCMTLYRAPIQNGVAENVAGDVNSKKRYHFLYPHVPLDMHTDHEYNDLSDRDLQAVKSHQRELAYKLGKPGAEEQSDIASHIQINRARSQYDQEQAHRRKVLDAEKIKRQARDAKRQQGVAEGKPQKKADRFHINKDGKPATLASYADKDSAVKDRDAKYPDAKVHQVGPRGKVKGEFEEGVAEGVSLKQKYEDKKRLDQDQVRYGKMTQAEFDKKWTRTERPKPTDKKQGVAEMHSQSPKGRMKPDGTRSHSTYGSRDHYSDSDPQHTAKPTTAKKTTKQAADILNKAFKDEHKKGVAEGSETAADIDKKIEFHKQGQAAAQYKGSMNKMHAAKIRELEAKKQVLKQGVAEGWSQKYKSSINCSHPKGFSQKAHCAGKKKHNESIEMEMVCEDCGMCETHSDHENLDEACWKGYHKAGNKKMFGKTYPNCVKNTNEEQHGDSCPHCGGELVSEELINEKKDACYYKVKSRYKVWPSAYASGALVKCRKKGADSWGNGSKNESSILEGIEQADESLHDWFNKEKWVRMDTKGNIKGPCAKEPGEGKPKCLPQAKAHSLGKKGRASAAARKRREDPNPDRTGKAINVNTKKTKG